MPGQNCPKLEQWMERKWHSCARWVEKAWLGSWIHNSGKPPLCILGLAHSPFLILAVRRLTLPRISLELYLLVSWFDAYYICKLSRLIKLSNCNGVPGVKVEKQDYFFERLGGCLYLTFQRAQWEQNISMGHLHQEMQVITDVLI